ncbi:YitT family protein [Brevibacillus sp. B_LB10_24]|uniref:YitT family protein n=1 Tax=Brevibacillus sp. B_LB10_24 TaxID=3380645 RepID=UPI0038B7DE91
MKLIISHVVRTVVVVIGSFLTAIGFNCFMEPHGVLPGGITGIAMLVQNLTSFPAGIQYFFYNIPLFILGWRYVGGQFLLYSIVGTTALSIFMDIVPPLPFLRTDDIMLACLFGGVISGLGTGIIIRGGGSTGGVDIIGVLIQKYFSFTVGSVGMTINAIVVCLSIFYFSVTQAMYSLIAMVMLAKLIDLVTASSAKKTVIVISAKTDQIANLIHAKLQRGATYLHGEGSYTQTKMRVLVCVVTRFELFTIQEIIYGVDPQAFVTITDTADVKGSFRRQSPFIVPSRKII